MDYKSTSEKTVRTVVDPDLKFSLLTKYFGKFNHLKRLLEFGPGRSRSIYKRYVVKTKNSKHMFEVTAKLRYWLDAKKTTVR